MASVKLKHYIKRKDGRYCYWQPTPQMVDAGFTAIPCGPDGPAAWKVAQEWEERWQAHRRGQEPPAARRWPKDSIGEGFERFRRSETWAKGKKLRTREDWERGWSYIEPVFGDQPANAVTFDLLDRWYHRLLAKHGVDIAYRAMKTWRSLWRVLQSMKLATGEDPSKAIRRKTPKPRNQVWADGEAVRMVKGAWRAGYKGLACIIAIAWDTSFSPVDVRTLTPADIREFGSEWGFAIDREKTGVDVYGTLTPRTRRLVKAYLDGLGAAVLPDAPLFRSRGHAPGPKGGRPRLGVPYDKNSLAADFRDVRSIVFGAGESRRLMDMRRSGSTEANAGGAAVTAISAKLGNSIDTNRALQRTYMPTQLATVRAADDARRKGRRALAEERNKPKKLKLGGGES